MSEIPRKDVFTERLKAARLMRGLGQAELAAKSGLPTTSISHFESGNRKPSFDNLRRLAKALDASTDYLLGRATEIGGAVATGDQLYRDVKNLSGRDREIAEDFMKVLASKTQKSGDKRMKRLGAEDAEAKAEYWLKQNGITTLPVDPFEIANQLEIEVRPKNDTESGVSGMLLRNGNAFGILYATHIQSVGFQRFSVGHELGHYLLEGHPDQLFPTGNGIHSSQAGFMSSVSHEREADHFACGLLMPDGPFRAGLRREAEGLEAIEAMAEKCLTSITATAIRYARKTSVPAAVIVSTDGRVDFVFLSGEMREFSGIIVPRKGEMVPADTLTSSFVRSQENVSRGRREEGDVELSSWLGGRRSIGAKEEVLGLGSYGKALTVITTDFLSDEEDEEADLEDRWTPRFSR